MDNIDRTKAAIRLLENEDFQEVVLNGFVKEGILEYSLQHNTRSEAILDELIARRILHEYFFGIIQSGDSQ